MVLRRVPVLTRIGEGDVAETATLSRHTHSRSTGLTDRYLHVRQPRDDGDDDGVETGASGPGHTSPDLESGFPQLQAPLLFPLLPASALSGPPLPPCRTPACHSARNCLTN